MEHQTAATRPARGGARRGVEIAQVGGYPELRVDGRPFFIHSAAFFYDRVPRDLWDEMLERYKHLGINTIDIYIPWNWHEPREGEFDFDGHTNPRRDLRGLLSLIAEKGLRLIARPGPEILNEWRHGGYPGWLLKRPEYKMDPSDWIEGRYPPLDNLNTRNAEAAAQGWLDNPIHMKQAAIWMAAVGQELAGYSANRMFHVKQKMADAAGEATADPSQAPKEEGGPLLFVQVGDDFAIGRTNYAGPAFWQYVEDLGKMLKAGGLDVPVFINPTDMRVSAAGSTLDPPVGAMGQWYMHPRRSEEAGALPLLTPRDASEIELFTEELKTQPAFPPVMIEYQAGWYTQADEDRPSPDPPSNTLLSSRLLIANGIHGFNYFPLQDTFTPAGYSVPWANRSYRWDAALSPDGDLQPRIQAVRRNARLLELWGPSLAASHKRADFGIVYPLGAYPQKLLKPADILDVSESVMRIERLSELSMLSSELLDPEFQPVEQLLRDPILFLPVFDPAKPQFQLSSRAQQKIVEYVRRGGTLVAFPARPEGETIGQLWKNAPPLAVPSPESAIGAKWQFGKGEVIETSRDFYSWVSLDQSFAASRSAEALPGARSALDEFFAAARVEPSLKFSPALRQAGDLIASEIVTDAGGGTLGSRTAGQGFLSLTNLSADSAAEGTFHFLPPTASPRGGHYPYPSLHIDVPPRESLLLPLDVSVCGPEVKDGLCASTIPSAGAEFLDAQREGRRLNLSFYVPARAEVNLHLAEKPSHVWLDQTDAHPESTWTPSSHELHLVIPKGAAPNFQRTLKLELPHAQRFKKERRRPHRAPAEDLFTYIANSVLLPTSGDAFLRTFPALVVPDVDQKKKLLLVAENRNENVSGDIDLSFERPLHGSKNLSVPAGGTASETIEFRPADLPDGGVRLPTDHLFHTAIEMRMGDDRRVLPVVFLLHSPGTEEHYRFDFDRDGADEWVLENDQLRLIVSPESGGRAIALTSKASGEDLSTSVGLLRDNFSFTPNPPGISEARKRGRYGLSNRSYKARWAGDAAHPLLRMDYDAPDVVPQGAAIEKTVRLDGADAVRVDYRIALHPAPRTKTSQNPSQSFVAVNSFPARANNGSPTRFCWRATAKKALLGGGSGSSSPEGDKTCENFVPDGAPLTVPAGISAVQIRTPARTGVEIGWDCHETCGRMTIEPRHFSALFQLQFPPLEPGGAAGRYSVRIRAVNAP
jgi:Glycosyl hydrolases family 35